MRKILVVGALAASAVGCVGMQSQGPAEDALQSLHGAIQSKPYVEAFIEYTGPADKWAGPSTFLMHVSAKDQGVAQVKVVPPLFGELVPAMPPAPGGPSKDQGPVNTTRAPAAAAPKGMPVEAAREQLGRIAGALQDGELPFRGCLSPVRVRLVRADGALLEKQGCRTYQGWPKVVSEAVSLFIAAGVK